MNRFAGILIGFLAITTVTLGQSVEHDIKLGAEAAVQLETQVGISDYPTATTYLDSIGTRLIKNLGNQPFTYEFKVLNMVEPNAMTLPGGHIYFSRGILALVNSEDELACIMGHEIIHAYKRHATKEAKKGIIPNILKIPGNIIKIVTPSIGNLVNAPIEGASKLLQANYSRQNENEADALGVKLASLSGYDPQSLGPILERLNNTVEMLSGQKQKFSYLDSHPWTPDRVKRINSVSTQLTIADKAHIAKTKEEFLSNLDGVMVSKDPAQGLFRDSLFLHPDLGFSIIFPSGWEYVNTPSTVGATHPKGEAQILLGIAGAKKDPSEYAKEFLKTAGQKGKLDLTRNEPIKVNGQNAHLITINENTSKGAISAHILWLNFGENTYQFIGIGHKQNEEMMKQTVLSFKPISTSEKESVNILVLRTLKVNKGETLEKIIERSGNVSNAKFLALINQLSSTEKIEQDQVIKIITKEPYK